MQTAALVSWGIVLFEHRLMVPANRIGYTELSIGQVCWGSAQDPH